MKKNRNQWKCNVYALLAAVIWGSAFVAQGTVTDVLGPFTFNTVRAFVAVAFLVILLLIRDLLRRKLRVKIPPRNKKMLWLGGLCTGLAVTFAANLQQAGIGGAGAGKAAFLTALYVVLVPIFGLFLGRRVSLTVGIAVPLAVVGLYLLCVKGEFVFAASDVMLILCAVVFSFHILIIDYFTRFADGVELSCLQFLFFGIFSFFGMILTEQPDPQAILSCTFPILYVGIFSSGVAYTLQIVAQSGSNPTIVSILFALESFFGLFTESVVGLLSASWQPRSAREYIGCAVMLFAVLLSQLPCRIDWGFRKRDPHEIR